MKGYVLLCLVYLAQCEGDECLQDSNFLQMQLNLKLQESALEAVKYSHEESPKEGSNSTNTTEKEKAEKESSNSTNTTEKEKDEKESSNSTNTTEKEKAEKESSNSTNTTEKEKAEKESSNSTNATEKEKVEAKKESSNSTNTTEKEKDEKESSNSTDTTKKEKVEAKKESSNSTNTTKKEKVEAKKDSSNSTNTTKKEKAVNESLETTNSTETDKVPKNYSKIKEVFKEKVKEQAERLLKKAEDAKTASEVARIGAKHNATVVVLDSRNFTQLRDDLSSATSNLRSAKDLSTLFEDCVVRATRAELEVRNAQQRREAALLGIHRLLNRTILEETELDDGLINELVRFNGSGVVTGTELALQDAVRAAELAKELQAADAQLKEALTLRDKALKEQRLLVEQIKEDLRSSVLLELNDASLVELLDASDRDILLTTTSQIVTSLPPVEPPKISEAQSEVLYPTDWAVIGSLIAVIVLVTLIVCYSRVN